jgi:hypothetical protein
MRRAHFQPSLLMYEQCLIDNFALQHAVRSLLLDGLLFFWLHIAYATGMHTMYAVLCCVVSSCLTQLHTGAGSRASSCLLLWF